MTLNELENRMAEFTERCRPFDEYAFVTAMYWPGRWLVTCAYLHLRGEGSTVEEAVKQFDKALTEHEDRDGNLARTLGIEAA